MNGHSFLNISNNWLLHIATHSFTKSVSWGSATFTTRDFECMVRLKKFTLQKINKKTVVLTTNSHLKAGVDSTPETLCEKHFRQWTQPNKFMLQVVRLLNPYSAKGLVNRLYATLHKMSGKVNYFVYFWSRKTLPYTHLEATSYIPQQGQSLHIWTTSLSTTGCYKNKYTIQFLWMACISRFAKAI